MSRLDWLDWAADCLAEDKRVLQDCCLVEDRRTLWNCCLVEDRRPSQDYCLVEDRRPSQDCKGCRPKDIVHILID